mgnify:CR=1 FL=1
MLLGLGGKTPGPFLLLYNINSDQCCNAPAPPYSGNPETKYGERAWKTLKDC